MYTLCYKACRALYKDKSTFVKKKNHFDSTKKFSKSDSQNAEILIDNIFVM
jgi:hypothetical protein